MPVFTTNQWVVLALVFVIGWLFGLLLTTGGRKWRQGFQQERALRISADNEVDRLRAANAELAGERDRRIALEQERDAHAARADAAGQRVTELEKHSPAINGSTAASIAAAASGQRDDLARIYGVGRGGEIRLNEVGVHRYADIINLSPTDEAALEGRLGLAAGSIADERWREQAEMLRKGEIDEHARRFA